MPFNQVILEKCRDGGNPDDLAGKQRLARERMDQERAEAIDKIYADLKAWVVPAMSDELDNIAAAVLEDMHRHAAAGHKLSHTYHSDLSCFTNLEKLPQHYSQHVKTHVATWTKEQPVSEKGSVWTGNIFQVDPNWLIQFIVQTDGYGRLSKVIGASGSIELMPGNSSPTEIRHSGEKATLQFSVFVSMEEEDQSTSQGGVLAKGVGEKRIDPRKLPVGEGVKGVLEATDISKATTLPSYEHDIIGYDQVKEDIGMMIRRFGLFLISKYSSDSQRRAAAENEIKRLKLSPPSGFLMYGPAGTGKTQFAVATAGELQRFLGPDIPVTLYQTVGTHKDKWLGNTEKNLHALFDAVENGRKPAILFMDEVEQILGEIYVGGGDGGSHSLNIEAIVKQRLTRLSAMEGVLVIMASNHPNRVPDAVKRAGRVDKKILIDRPDSKTKHQMMKRFGSDFPESLPFDPAINFDAAADTLAGGRAVGADFVEFFKQLKDAVLAIEYRIRIGTMPVIVRAKGADRLLVPQERVSTAPNTIEEARTIEKRIDPAIGVSPQTLGLDLEYHAEEREGKTAYVIDRAEMVRISKNLFDEAFLSYNKNRKEESF